MRQTSTDNQRSSTVAVHVSKSLVEPTKPWTAAGQASSRHSDWFGSLAQVGMVGYTAVPSTLVRSGSTLTWRQTFLDELLQSILYGKDGHEDSLLSPIVSLHKNSPSVTLGLSPNGTENHTGWRWLQGPWSICLQTQADIRILYHMSKLINGMAAWHYGLMFSILIDGPRWTS
jgi:hypothetical protein